MGILEYAIISVISMIMIGCQGENPGPSVETVESRPTKEGDSSVSVNPRATIQPNIPTKGASFVKSGKSDPAPVIDTSNASMEVIAFGDWGTGNHMMYQAMKTFNTKFPKPDAVFLLGDNFYSDHEASTFDLFTKHVAPPGTNRQHYVVLGNHDYLHGLQKQLSYNKQDPRWILPSKYYFKRFNRNGFDVCVWFLDTEGILTKGDTDQIPWLETSIKAEAPTCRWKIVNGHHPLMHASPIPGQCPSPLFPIKPILGRNKVHMYISGHHHNTQFLQHEPSGVYYAIAGGIVEQRSTPDPTKFVVKGRKYIWGTGATSAVMRLVFESNSMTVEFHSGSNPNQPVLYSHKIL